MAAFGTSEAMGVDGDRPQHTSEARSNILYIPHSSLNRILPPDHPHTHTASCSYSAAVDRRLCCAGANARASRRVLGPGGCRLSFGSRHKHLQCNVATITSRIRRIFGFAIDDNWSWLAIPSPPPDCRSAAHGSHLWTTGAELWSAVLQTSCGADDRARHPLKMC